MRGNRIELTGRLAATATLRHTPAGLPTVQLRIAHVSQQEEGGRARRVEFEAEGLAFGAVAVELAKLPPGCPLGLTGFLDRKSARNPQPIVHVTEYVLLEE